MVAGAGGKACRRVDRQQASALAEQFVDLSLQLPLLDLASAQPLRDIGSAGLSALKATPTKLSRHQITLARKERPLRAMRSDSCSLGNWTSLLNSMVAPRSEILRTMHSRVAPRSPISATPPYITLSRTLSRRSRIECLPIKMETFTPLCSP
jgi:hypothetical protein